MIRDLSETLYERGLALANLGDIDVQTISGAISTATHGTGERLRNISSQVEAIELVAADGTRVECSRDSDPDLWRAARVGLGSLGVIASLTLLMRRNQGLIMLTGHYSNWEVLGYVLATMGFPTSSVARPLDNPYISEFVFGVRERTGQRIIHKKGATQEVVDVLESHGVVAFIADQNAGSKGLEHY